MDSSWPVEIRPIGLAAGGTVVWRFRGQLRVTAVVKATFSFVPGGAMAIEEPDDILVDDVHYDADPGASLWAGSDLAPFRMLADVVAVGHAYVLANGGAARLALFRDRTALIDKTIQVAGNATGEMDEIVAVPLTYERALGGRSSSDNPVGTGKRAGSPLPDLIDPADPRRSIGFGAIARGWPRRARLLGTIDRSVVDQPLAEIPSNFDWAYFQAAPAGQTTEFLRGDEWIVLEGMSPEHKVLQTCLPGAAGAGRIYGLGSADARPVPIAFRADNLHIDADRGRCSVTWRASFSVPSEEALQSLVILAGVEFPGYPISWPDAVRVEPLPTEEDVAPELVEEDVDFDDTTTRAPAVSPQGRQSTVLLSWGEEGTPPAAADSAPPRRQSTVLLEWSQGGPPGAPTPPAPGRQSTVVLAWSEGVVPQPLPAPRAPQATVQLEWEGGAPDASQLLPFSPPPVAVPDDDNPLMGTIAFTEEQASTPMPMPSPFNLAAPGTSRAEALGDIPGAPWASTIAPLVPRPFQAEETRSLVLRETLILPDDVLEPEAPTAKIHTKATPAADPEPAIKEAPAVIHDADAAGKSGPTTPDPPEAASSEESKERSWSWATVAEPVRDEPPRAPSPPRVKPQVVVKNSLYGRFSPAKKK
ncbi:MAG: DUF2169 domain-containing protein [Minicystis sp.]